MPKMFSALLACTVFVVVLALVVCVRICGRRDMHARPSGWIDADTEICRFTATCKDTTLCISVRHLRWDQRFDVAYLIARAHQFTAAYVHLLESIAPADPLSADYAYTTESREALLASKSKREVRPADKSLADRRIQAMRWILERNLTMLHGNKNTYVGVDIATGKLVCFAMLIDPLLDTYSLWDKIRVGLLAAPFELGWFIFWRLLTMPSALDSIEARALAQLSPGLRYLRLERVAVQPEFQGAGIGKGLMLAINGALDRQGKTGYLSTQNERTEIMYKRYGWETLSVETCCAGSSFPFLTWQMRRTPGSS